MPREPQTNPPFESASAVKYLRLPTALRSKPVVAVGDYLVALETYRAAVNRWPKDKITLRNRARVIEQSWRD